uniref:Vacuolar amino acid transporter 1 n=1 Tax=Sipha flava TaxID=143950 RepID=A0A2S2PV93_9HEMI
MTDEDGPPALSAADAEQLGEQLFRNQVSPRTVTEGGHVGHLVRGSTGNGQVDYSPRCPACNPLLFDGASVQVTYIDEYVGSGFNTRMSSMFIVGELTGIGMLVAPWAVVKLGWLGFVMLAAFAVATAYSSTCLGTCWLILEERAMENRHYPVRDPYSTIAFHSFGKIASIISTTLINVTLFGAATVYLMLTAEAAHRLFSSSHPEATFCTWLVVFSVSMSSLMFVENPKDSRIVALTALLTALTACYLVIMQILLDIRNQEGNLPMLHDYEWNTDQFFLSYGTILFCYGGAVSFPVVQNEMFKVNRYSRSLITVFSMMAFIFGTIVVISYVAYDVKIEPNLFMSLGDSWCSIAAIGLMIAHLILGFIIIANPLSQQLENLFNTPQESFSFQRFIVRMGMLVAMIFLGQIVPNFNFLVSLIGSSTISFTTFVLPSLFYLKLCVMQHPNWPDRYESIL